MKLFFTLFLMLNLFIVQAKAETLALEIEVDLPELHNSLEIALSLPEALSAEATVNKRWLRYFQRQLPHKVTKTLQPLGYFNSQTVSQVVQTEDGHKILKVQVNAGKPILINKLDLQITGSDLIPEKAQQLKQNFPLHVNDVLRQDIYDQGKALLLNDVVNLGFLDAKFTQHQLKVDQADYQAEVILHLDTGSRYAFGQTTFSHQTEYPLRFLRRYVSYRQGQVFSYEELGQTQLRLLNTDLFKKVNVAPERDQANDGQIPITIELEPAAQHQWRFGLGYGTDTGGRTSLRYQDLNLFRQGHDLKGDLLLAQYQQSLVSTYTMPDLDRLDSQTQFHIGFDREDTESYLSRELFSEAEYQRTINKHLGGAVFLRLTHEYSEISEEKNKTQLLLPGIRLQWYSQDRNKTGQKGLFSSLEIKGAHDNLLSDVSLLQLKGQLNGRFSLSTTLSGLIRLQGGTTWLDESFSELPASLRFFAGGDRSVRGYGYESLGPEDDGEVVGGKHLLVANFELEQKFTAKWGGAMFYDLGNAFDSFADFKLEQGVGLGLRRYTPIGPIRLDLARQIGRPDPRWRLHLSIGFEW
jgi:translocation and assembly module TamA